MTTYPTMIAMGGLQTDGTINRTVYTSSDFGMSWQKLVPSNAHAACDTEPLAVVPPTISACSPEARGRV